MNPLFSNIFLLIFSNKQSQPQVLQPDVCREPSDIMALLELEDVFPHIHFTTLQELYSDCGGNASQVANFLTEDAAIKSECL